MNQSKPKVILRALLLSYLLSGFLLFLVAFILYRLKLKEGQINLAIYFIYGAACVLGGLLSGKAIQNRRFFWGLLTGLLYFTVLFFVSWIMNHGILPAPETMAPVLACCAAGGTAGGMLS